MQDVADGGGGKVLHRRIFLGVMYYIGEINTGGTPQKNPPV